jgi:hypothetical protein
LGLDCKVGFFERPERVVVTILGLLLGPLALTAAIWTVVVFSWLTVLQRIAHVRRVVLEQERAEGVPGTGAASSPSDRVPGAARPPGGPLAGGLAATTSPPAARKPLRN